MTEEQILKDPTTSDWLRDTLRSALACDPVRAANDAMVLATALQERAARLAAVEEMIGAVKPARARATR